jgi:hypothetical protein
MTSFAHHTRTRTPRAAGTLLLVVLVSVVAWSVPAVATTAATPASSATNSAGKTTFGIGPSSGSGPDGRAAFNFDVTPGAHLSDRLAVVNFTDQPVVLAVYPVDADPDDQGGAQLPPAGTKLVAAGSWFHLSLEPGGQVSVPPNSTVNLLFSVEIPPGATPGDHEAALIGSLSTFALNKQGTRVRIDQRIAVRAYIRVAGALTPRLEIQQLHASYHPGSNPVSGTVTASYVVRNAGNVRLGARQQVSVHGLFGSTAEATHLAALPVLPPGASEPVSVHISGVVPEIHGEVKVQLQPVAATGDVDGALVPVEASRGIWTVPWLLIAIIFVILLALYGARRWRRRSRRPDPAPPAASRDPREVVSA